MPRLAKASQRRSSASASRMTMRRATMTELIGMGLGFADVGLL